MAKLKATPKNYAEALAVLAGRESVRLGNNTYLENLSEVYASLFPCANPFGLKIIAVRLHNTYIVRFHENGSVTLYTGGYRTVTTKERINHFILSTVYQKDYEWFVYRGGYPPSDGSTVEFEEGMEV